MGDVRGRGLMIGIEIVDPTKGKDVVGKYLNSAELTNYIKKACLHDGLIIGSGGRHSSVLRLLPPLVISMNEIKELLAKLEAALKKASEMVLLNSLKRPG